MSLLKANSIQVGQSATASQNFTITTPTTPDGTLKISRGNAGATTGDVIAVNANGAVGFGSTPAYGSAGQALISQGTGAAPTWGAAGATISDDTSTNASYYPSLETATSGASTTVKVSSTKLYFNPSTGTLNATIFNSLSDATQKTNVVKVENATATLKKIDGVEFDWNDNGKHSAGVVAQKLEEILPFLVETNENGIKSVNYAGLIAYLIEANKELATRVEALETK